MVDLTKEDWVQWLDNPVTKALFSMITERREEFIAQLAYGNVTSSRKQDITIGAINAYTHILGMRFEETNNDRPNLG
jgi:hypothetical protein